MPSTKYCHIATGATTLEKSGQGLLNTIIVNATVAGSIALDGALSAVSGTEISTLKASTVGLLQIRGQVLDRFVHRQRRGQRHYRLL